MYITTNEIRQRLGCSGETARRIARQMPCLQIGRGRGAVLRVKEEDFEKYIADNTRMPGEAIPRESPLETETQRAQWEIKDWHAKRRTA